MAAFLIIWLLVFQADWLVRFGLAGRLYYLALVPLGLAAAGFLFGVLRSYAFYRGHAVGGSLLLGGPAAAFALVILGGVFLVPDSEAFDLTVFVYGEGGVQDVPLRNQGFVVLDLGPERRREAVGAGGQAHFVGIPANFRSQEVQIWVEAEGYAPARTVKRRLEGSSLYLAVSREPLTLRGRIEDTHGRAVEGAEIRLRGVTSISGRDGSFVLQIQPGRSNGELTLKVSAQGYRPWADYVVPDSNEVVVALERMGPGRAR